MMVLYLKIKASKGNANNTNPRAQTETLKADPVLGDAISRGMAAHNNGLESFPVFAAGILACMAAGVDRRIAGKIASAHLLLRGAFNICYVLLPPSEFPVGVMRTFSWAMSLLA